ncbi:GNAT family N-acetyltransferase [Arthrobacter sp.]|uniref:GNAT family N-acetyltransferase n=1 Tax=Arthrobacter sp. TaxID=1667 RepID=UPI003A8E4173
MAEAIDVTPNTAQHRYDITVDGQAAGSSSYRDTEDAGTPQRILYHTLIDDAFGGRGLASVLTREAIRQSVDAGFRVVPMCPYVVKWTTTHDDFAEHIDPVSSAHTALFD